MNIDDLTIGEAKKLSTIFSKLSVASSESATEASWQIVVLDRGFVYVGKTRIEEDFVVIENALNIRVWGTTNGLGELRNGPTPSTKVDETGTVRAPIRALISFIATDGSKWLKKR